MLSKWELYALGLVLLIAVGGGLYAAGHHNGYREREDKDAVATAQLQKKVDQETQALRDRATAAENKFALEHQQLDDYRASHPTLDTSRLCDAPGKANLSTAKGIEPGTKGTSAPAPVGVGVPAADSWSGEDRRALLGAFASLFDHENSRLREAQTR